MVGCAVFCVLIIFHTRCTVFLHHLIGKLIGSAVFCVLISLGWLWNNCNIQTITLTWSWAVAISNYELLWIRYLCNGWLVGVPGTPGWWHYNRRTCSSRSALLPPSAWYRNGRLMHTHCELCVSYNIVAPLYAFVWEGVFFKSCNLCQIWCIALAVQKLKRL